MGKEFSYEHICLGSLLSMRSFAIEESNSPIPALCTTLLCCNVWRWGAFVWHVQTLKGPCVLCVSTYLQLVDNWILPSTQPFTCLHLYLKRYHPQNLQKWNILLFNNVTTNQQANIWKVKNIQKLILIVLMQQHMSEHTHVPWTC